ncbi:hypothetical protein EYC58_03680 [Candidatus Saccharibacteria bacterium]|nr:MAG: hypothetical protein EYC58_03680 [Candidatus Saccharibacteria bacterium]
MLIGVFDSGLGGHFVAARLRNLMPDHEFTVVDDHDHVPYGDRVEREIVRLTETALQPLLKKTKVIVIACNTATAVAIDYLRDKYPGHQFVGFEPMIKPLSTMTKRGAILATKATIESERYQALKQLFHGATDIKEPDTTDWATNIENGRTDAIRYDELDQMVIHGVDLIALSCTHYLEIEDYLRKRYDGLATIIEPTTAVADRLRVVIDSLPQQ